MNKYTFLAGPSIHSLQAQKRELEVAVRRARKALQSGKERWRRLVLERQTLKQRICAHQLLPGAPGPFVTSPRQVIKVIELADQLEDPFGAVKGNNQLIEQPGQGCKQHKNSKGAEHGQQMVQGLRHSWGNENYPAYVKKPISSFQQHAIISFSAVSKYMTPQEFRSASQFNFQELRHAIITFQTETAQRLDVPASEICWFVEWPYSGPSQQCLCASFLLWSRSCKLSAMISRIAITLECSFLVLEHEHLESSTLPSSKPPAHPILDDANVPFPPRPQPPQAAALASASARCGVDEFIQVESVLRAIIDPMLQRYKGFLPLGKWLAVCKQIMRVGGAMIDALHAIPDCTPVEGRTNTLERSSDQGEGGENESLVRLHLTPEFLIRLTSCLSSWLVEEDFMTSRNMYLLKESCLWRSCVSQKGNDHPWDLWPPSESFFAWTLHKHNVGVANKSQFTVRDFTPPRDHVCETVHLWGNHFDFSVEQVCILLVSCIIYSCRYCHVLQGDFSSLPLSTIIATHELVLQITDQAMQEAAEEVCMHMLTS
jgi:hypothetical protein